MNKISRLLLVFLLTILTVFAVSACTKKEDNQDNKTTMTEEPGIPLETYLNGNFTNVNGDFTSSLDVKKTLKPSKHSKRTANVFNAMSFNFNRAKTKQVGNLKIHQYSNVSNLDSPKVSGKKQKTIDIVMSSNLYFWNGVEVSYSISYYKDGKNIYTKYYQQKKAVEKKQQITSIKELQNIKEPGVYLLHIHHMTHIIGYWDAEEKITRLKDHVFAFQIGDGDDVG